MQILPRLALTDHLTGPCLVTLECHVCALQLFLWLQEAE